MARHLQLIGFGNALVDIEFSVSHVELASTGLRKGGMTLADETAQKQLLERFLATHRGQLTSGGSAANTIVAFAQFGGSAGYISALGNDSHGSFFAAEFDDFGIALFAPRLEHEVTGTCIVMVTPDGERTMQTYLGASDLFDRPMLDLRIFDYAEWLYVEGYKLTSPHGAEAVEEAIYHARKRGVNIALSFSDAFVVTACYDIVESLIQHVDLIFCNDREARAFTRVEDEREAFEILKCRVQNLVFTLGPKGSIAKLGTITAQIPAYPTTVIDTNGAGDMYAGAFLFGLLHGWDCERSGHFAARAAARVIAQYGARWRGNHKEIVAEALDHSRWDASLAGSSQLPNPANNSPS
ncbi:MAG: adenosine kinase [Chlorobi bacterium]|nr:adenosine kinase [Chlorobiota bacterium]